MSVTMKRFALALALAVLACNSAAEWVMVYDNDEYIAYADPATISREGHLAQMSDLIDLKSPQSSPYGKTHASSMALSEFSCENSRVRTIAFSLHSGQMGEGDVVETIAESNRWLPVAPGTLLNVLWQLACGQTDGTGPLPRQLMKDIKRFRSLAPVWTCFRTRPARDGRADLSDCRLLGQRSRPATIVNRVGERPLTDSADAYSRPQSGYPDLAVND